MRSGSFASLWTPHSAVAYTSNVLLGKPSIEFKVKVSIVICMALAALGSVSAEDKAQEKTVPELDGQPVFLILGKVVVRPKGVETPPKDYQGAMQGTEPIDIIKIDGKIVGEVYGTALKGAAKDEADGMSRSAGKSPQITLIMRSSATRTNLLHEITTLRMDVDSALGRPWVVHSLYFPREDHSVTFKLVTAEKDFDRVLPLFDAMLFAEEFMKKPVKDSAKAAEDPKEQGKSEQGNR